MLNKEHSTDQLHKNTHFFTAKSRTSGYFHPKAQGCSFPAHCSATWKWNIFLHTFDAVPPSTKSDTKEDFTALNITEYTYFAFWSWLTDPQIYLVLSNLAEVRNKS